MTKDETKAIEGLAEKEPSLSAETTIDIRVCALCFGSNAAETVRQLYVDIEGGNLEYVDTPDPPVEHHEKCPWLAARRWADSKAEPKADPWAEPQL